jgi:hypothetical protein
VTLVDPELGPSMHVPHHYRHITYLVLSITQKQIPHTYFNYYRVSIKPIGISFHNSGG